MRIPEYMLGVYLILVCILHFALTTYSDAVTNDYCDGEHFEADCGPDQVVIIHSALYGRMHLGRCVTADLGFLGCHTSVINILDSLCTGTLRCEIANINRGLFPVHLNCYSELQVYLQVTYSCEYVQSIEPSCDGPTKVIRLSHKWAYLASQQLYNIKCSSILLQASPGQLLNLTLLDLQTDAQPDAQSKCYSIAKVEDRSTGQVQVLCGGRYRESNIMISHSHSVELTLDRQQDWPFLVKYQVLGCADPLAPISGWVERDGDKAYFGCDVVDSPTWTLHCVSSTWVGTSKNCSNEVLLTLVVCIAAIICVTTVACFMVCWKRHTMKLDKSQYQKINIKYTPESTVPCPELEFMIPHHRTRMQGPNSQGLYDFCVTPTPTSVAQPVGNLGNNNLSRNISSSRTLPHYYRPDDNKGSTGLLVERPKPHMHTLPIKIQATKSDSCLDRNQGEPIPSTSYIIQEEEEPSLDISPTISSPESMRSSEDSSLDSIVCSAPTLQCREKEGPYGQLMGSGDKEEEAVSPLYKSLVFFDN